MIPALTMKGGSQWRTPVYVGAGILADPALWDLVFPVGGRVALVTDDNVVAHYGDRLGSGLANRSINQSVVPAGEASKSRQQKVGIEDHWIDSGIGRDGYCVALGGGVVGDLAGFCAATYLRGIPVVQVPTSLVAMVDSSIGGKTGIDIPSGKNLIGAFHPPRAIIVDVDVLSTLPDDELRNGLAEVVKHGAIADASLLDFVADNLPAIFARDTDILTELVTRNISIKANVVEQDEKEGGLRQILNFGHTVAHALELLANYDLAHGAAVAIGMVAECRMAETVRGLPADASQRLSSLLEQIGLPTRCDLGFPVDAVLNASQTDKKVRQGQVRYALINRLGGLDPDPQFGFAVPVPDDAARAALELILQNP